MPRSDSSPLEDARASSGRVRQRGDGINDPAAARCILCQGSLHTKYQIGTSSILYCGVCELGRLAPFPTAAELEALYGSRQYFEGGDGVGYADYVENAEQFERTFRAKVRELLRHGPVGSLVEIGCGPGYFLLEAKRAGIAAVAGVDRNPWAIEQARRNDLEAHVGSIDVLEPERKFDAVAMLDLIEHITEPAAFLDQVRDRLNPGGRIFIMTPNIRSLLARVAGSRWVSFKIPEHVYYYSPRSMTRLLEESGFEILTIKGTGQYVTIEFLLSRLRRLVPRLTVALDLMARPLRLHSRVVFVTNGSIDVVARVK